MLKRFTFKIKSLVKIEFYANLGVSKCFMGPKTLYRKIIKQILLLGSEIGLADKYIIILTDFAHIRV